MNDIYPKYMDTRYHACPKIWISPFYYLLIYLNTAGWETNSEDPDQMP